MTFDATRPRTTSLPTPPPPADPWPFPVTSPGTALREKALKRLDNAPQLKPVYEKISALVKDLSQSDSESRYEIGVQVQAVRQDEQKYGKGAVSTLATLVGYKRSTLYEYGKVAATWDRDAFEDFASRLDAQGQPLTFSHFVTLSSVDDLANRLELYHTCLEQCLTIGELRTALRKYKTSIEMAADGTAQAALDRIASICRDLRSSSDQLGNELPALLAQSRVLEPRQVKELLAGAIQLHEQLISVANTNRGMLKGELLLAQATLSGCPDSPVRCG